MFFNSRESEKVFKNDEYEDVNDPIFKIEVASMRGLKPGSPVSKSHYNSIEFLDIFN